MESVDVAQLLPDELWLEVFSFLEPAHAGGAILTCRRFHDIFATPTLWRRYHETLVGGPLQLVRGPSLEEERDGDSVDDQENVEDDDEDDDNRFSDDEGKEIDATKFPHFPPADGWRQALSWKLAQVQRQRGDEAKLVWAARLGCHRLVLRLLEDMRDRYDSLRGGERSALNSTLPEDEDSEDGRMLRMCCRALAAACQANSVPTARVLLAYGAAPVECGYLGVKREAIVEAVEHDNVELMELLITYGALSSRWSFADSLPGRPLLAACWAGKTEAVECLMRHDVMCVASKNEFIERWGIAVNLEGVSPLCMAAKRGHLNVVSLLLSRLKEELNESEKRNALLSASRENKNDVIQHLIAHGGVSGDVASLCAYVRGKSFDCDTFEALLQGVDAASLEAANVSWLIFKSKRMAGGPDGVRVCQLLQAKGADINGASPDRPDHTPLSHAVAKDNLEVVETLLRCGADPSLPALGEADLLGLAQRLKNPRMIALIAKHARDPDAMVLSSS